jgi:hypothetical protein
MSQPKELRYFWRDDWYESRDWYAGHFRADARIRGESTPGYSMWPVHEDVPERAARLIPDAKIVYVVRDPVERVVSHYHQRRADGVRVPLDAYLKSVARPDNVVVCPSRYYTQLSRWLTRYDRSQVLIVDSEDLRVGRASAVADVFAFLGLRQPDGLALDVELNSSTEKAQPTAAGQFGARIGLWRLSAHLPEAVKKPMRPAARTVMFRKLELEVTLDASNRRRLEEHLRPEAEAFRERVGRAFPSWSV